MSARSRARKLARKPALQVAQLSPAWQAALMGGEPHHSHERPCPACGRPVSFDARELGPGLISWACFHSDPPCADWHDRGIVPVPMAQWVSTTIELIKAERAAAKGGLN